MSTSTVSNECKACRTNPCAHDNDPEENDGFDVMEFGYERFQQVVQQKTQENIERLVTLGQATRPVLPDGKLGAYRTTETFQGVCLKCDIMTPARQECKKANQC